MFVEKPTQSGTRYDLTPLLIVQILIFFFMTMFVRWVVTACLCLSVDGLLSSLLKKSSGNLEITLTLSPSLLVFPSLFLFGKCYLCSI